MGNMCLVYTKEEKKSVTVIWCISGTYILVEQKEKKKPACTNPGRVIIRNS